MRGGDPQEGTAIGTCPFTPYSVERTLQAVDRAVFEISAPRGRYSRNMLDTYGQIGSSDLHQG
jgi:hypothetical protein